MAQLKNPVEPFGEVNVWARGGRTHVTATILMRPFCEGTRTGIALDGSMSMAESFGIDKGSKPLSKIFAPRLLENLVRPVARKIAAHLVTTLDPNGTVSAVYWSTGRDGTQVQSIGELTAAEAEAHPFNPPAELGNGTYLAPAMRYFLDKYSSAPWGFFVVITDGEIHDMNEVKEATVLLARDIAAGRRKPVKMVLIGLGQQVNERQLAELDDLDTGTGIDIWDHKLAATMRSLDDIFAEAVRENMRVASDGRVLDPNGQVVANYEGVGLPAFLEFDLKQGDRYFVLEFAGNRIVQPLTDEVGTLPDSVITPEVQEQVDDVDADWRKIHLVMRKDEDSSDVELDHSAQ
jgi:hypothetical protein